MSTVPPYNGQELASLVLMGLTAHSGRTWLRSSRGEYKYGDLARRASAYQNVAMTLAVQAEDVIVFCSDDLLDQYAVLVAGIMGSFRPVFAVGAARESLLRAALRICTPRLVIADNPALELAGNPAQVLSPSMVRDADLGLNVEQQQIPFVSHTSGSLGSPRFIWVDGAGLASFATWSRSLFELEPDDVWGEGGDLASDLSLTNAVICLASSAEFVAVQGADRLRLARIFSEQGVTAMRSVPSTAQLMLRSGRGRLDLPRLRLAAFGGDRLTKGLVSDFAESAGRRVEFCNTYGKAEVAGFMSYHRFSAHARSDRDGETVPIGRPVPGVTLSLGGPEITRGDLIAVSNRVAVEISTREGRAAPVKVPGEEAALATGDTAELKNGLLHFVGRSDRNVKVAGHLISLDELEAIARGVLGEPVCAVQTGGSVGLLVESDGSGTTASAVRMALSPAIPAQFVPSKVVFVPTFPRNASGKVDFPSCQRILGDSLD